MGKTGVGNIHKSGQLCAAQRGGQRSAAAAAAVQVMISGGRRAVCGGLRDYTGHTRPAGMVPYHRRPLFPAEQEVEIN